jgi:hypothetical protein
MVEFNSFFHLYCLIFHFYEVDQKQLYTMLDLININSLFLIW